MQAKGAGYAILQMHVQYNVDIEKFQTKPPVAAFNLDTKATFHGRNQSHITYVSCQRYVYDALLLFLRLKSMKKLIFRWTNLNESIRSGMAVLDVGIPTGYWIQQQKLDSYILSRRVRNLQRARYQEKKVLFYFDFVSTIRVPQCDYCCNFFLFFVTA